MLQVVVFVSLLSNHASSHSGIQRISVGAESNGRIKSAVPNDHHIPVVSELIRYSLPQQEGSARRENLLLTSRGLFPRVRW